MIITRLDVRRYQIPLKIPLVTARGDITSRQGLILRATGDSEVIGYGEIAPLDGFGQETLAAAEGMIASHVSRLPGVAVPPALQDLKVLMAQLDTDWRIPLSVGFGIETMFADLAAQASGLPICKWYDHDAVDRVAVNAILSGTLNEIAGQLEAKLPHGYRTFKLKVGIESLECDIEKIKLIRSIVGRDSSIRLDANRSFEYSQAVKLLNAASEYGIEYIEEPLREQDFRRTTDLRRECGVKVAFDEWLSLPGFGQGYFRAFERLGMLNALEMIDAAIIKPALLGGPAVVLPLGRFARATGLKLALSSTIETGIGLASVLHIAAAIGDCLLPSGLDTLGLLENFLLAESLEIENGAMRVPARSGLGVTIRDFDANPYLSAVS